MPWNYPSFRIVSLAISSFSSVSSSSVYSVNVQVLRDSVSGPVLFFSSLSVFFIDDLTLAMPTLYAYCLDFSFEIQAYMSCSLIDVYSYCHKDALKAI